MLDYLIHIASQAADFAFWYCVDFMVNLAGLTHSPYVEANTWVLLLLIPTLFALLISLRVMQRRQLHNLRTQTEVSAARKPSC